MNYVYEYMFTLFTYVLVVGNILNTLNKSVHFIVMFLNAQCVNIAFRGRCVVNRYMSVLQPNVFVYICRCLL